MSRKPKILLDLPFPVDRLQVSGFFTSRPYPVVQIDSMQPGFSLDTLELRRIRVSFDAPVESVEPALALDSLNLRPLLQEYSYDEGIDPVLSLD
ncbi:MAG: hypothetical protein EA406_02185, partial [Rhodospirillales bacterium]